MGAFRDSGAGAGVGAGARFGNFLKRWVRVWRDSVIKKLLKIFLFIFSIYFYYLNILKKHIRFTKQRKKAKNTKQKRKYKTKKKCPTLSPNHAISDHALYTSQPTRVHQGKMTKIAT